MDRVKNVMNANYLIKNLIKKKMEKDFSFNPVAALLFSIFTGAGFVLYYSVISGLDLKEFVIFLYFPVIMMVMFSLAGRWESVVLLDLIAVICYFWWKGSGTLYFTIPVSLGTLFAPVFQIVKEWERAVTLRFGKFHKLKGPGLFLILPLIDSINKIVDLRIRSTDFVAETTLTKDSVPVTVDGLAFWMIWDGEKAVLEVENFMDAVVLSAQAALRDSIGKTKLSTLVEQREEIGEEIRSAVDKKTTEWGITIQSIEITDIIIPEHLQDAMSKRAQAEREKESRIILGEAEVELARKFSEASGIYGTNTTALKLRHYSILNEGLKSGNSMMMVPSNVLENIEGGDVFGIAALEELNKKKGKRKEDNEKESG